MPWLVNFNLLDTNLSKVIIYFLVFGLSPFTVLNFVNNGLIFDNSNMKAAFFFPLLSRMLVVYLQYFSCIQHLDNIDAFFLCYHTEVVCLS